MLNRKSEFFAMHCPIKPENKTDQDYRNKILGDLKKAKKLHDTGKLKVKKWTFITPGKLSNEVIVYLKRKAKEFEIEGSHLEATFLANEFYRNKHLIEKFPRLSIPSIESKLDEIHKDIKELKKTHKEEVTFPVTDKKFEGQRKNKQSEDLKRIFQILSNPQTETSKEELRTIFYKTLDRIAQVNAVLGLLNWHDPLEDKDEDMVELCNQGIRLADASKSKVLRANFLAAKGTYLSSIWAKKDMETAYTIKAGNLIGLQMLSEEQKQGTITELRLLEEQFTNAFSEAVDIAIEINNANVLAQVCLNIGQAAGGRYIHLKALNVQRAEREKVLSKRMLLHAKELYGAIGYELGVGYAILNLANQLCIFGEKTEAVALNNEATKIGIKYNDLSLLQSTKWLKQTLTTGKVPDYIHGERRERKV